MLQRHHLDVVVARQVNAANDADQSRYVRGAVRNDQHIRAGVRRQVSELRYQGPQNRHELGRADVLHLNNLRHNVVGASGIAGAEGAGILPGCRIWNDLDDVATLHRGELMHLENRKERFVKCLRRHWCGRQHRDFCIDPRVDNEILVRHCAYRLDDLADVRLLVIRRNRHLLGQNDGRDGGPQEACDVPLAQ